MEELDMFSMLPGWGGYFPVATQLKGTTFIIVEDIATAGISLELVRLWEREVVPKSRRFLGLPGLRLLPYLGHWKDEDQLEVAVSVGLFSRAKALMIRKKGEGVINLISENQTPLCDGWEKWIPPAHWSSPKLWVDWDLGYR